MVSTKEKTSGSYSLRISENALHNIREITGYIAFVKHQPINAIKVGDKIFETIERIQLNPFSFRECEEIPTKTKIYRKAVCMSWLIIFIRLSDLKYLFLGLYMAVAEIRQFEN